MIDYENDSTRDRIDANFAAQLALAEASPQSQSVASVGKIAADLLSGRVSIPPDEWAAIRASPVLFASWNYMRTSLTLAELPRVAAASSGSLTSRTFADGGVTKVASTKPGASYVKILWHPKIKTPRSLLLQGDNRPPLIRPLPKLRPTGDWLILCDDEVSDDREFLAALWDPRSIGSFLE